MDSIDIIKHLSTGHVLEQLRQLRYVQPNTENDIDT